MIIHIFDGKCLIWQSGTTTNIEMSIDNLVKLFNEAPAGNTVRLLSCNNEAAALELAKYTNRTFYASDGWVDINKAGDIASENPFYKFAEGKKTEGFLEHVTDVEGEAVRLGNIDIDFIQSFFVGEGDLWQKFLFDFGNDIKK